MLRWLQHATRRGAAPPAQRANAGFRGHAERRYCCAARCRAAQRALRRYTVRPQKMRAMNSQRAFRPTEPNQQALLMAAGTPKKAPSTLFILFTQHLVLLASAAAVAQRARYAAMPYAICFRQNIYYPVPNIAPIISIIIILLNRNFIYYYNH